MAPRQDHPPDDWRDQIDHPVRWFDRSPGVIRLMVLICVNYPLSLRDVEDLLAERGIDRGHETVRLESNSFGLSLAA